MAILENISFSPNPADDITVMYQKLNAAIDAVNRITADNTLKTIVAEIGDWDMDTDTYAQLDYSDIGIADPTKIRSIDVLIRGDVGSGKTGLVPLNCAHITDAGDCFGDSTDTEPQGGVDFATTCTDDGAADILTLYRKPSGLFDTVNYNATSYNRGFVKITFEI